jgi:hypothetical protein
MLDPAWRRQVRVRLTRHITGSEDPRIARSPVPVYDDPAVTAQSSPAREADLRVHPDANHHGLSRQPPAVRQDNLLDVAVTGKRLDLDTELDLDTVVAVQVQQPRGQLWSQCPRQRSRQLFDHRYADSGASSGRRKLQPDKAGPDDDQRPTPGQLVVQLPRIVCVSQCQHAVQPRASDPKHQRMSSCSQQHRVGRKHLSVIELDSPPNRVEPADTSTADQLDIELT